MASKTARAKPLIRGIDTKRIREALGLTQTQWRKRIGVTVVTVSRWENGHRDPAVYHHAKLRAAAREAGIELP